MSECVLVADDDPDILSVVKINFELDDFEVDTAVDGEDALQKATSNPPEVIGLDIMMPRMDGLTAPTVSVVRLQPPTFHHLVDRPWLARGSGPRSRAGCRRLHHQAL